MEDGGRRWPTAAGDEPDGGAAGRGTASFKYSGILDGPEIDVRGLRDEWTDRERALDEQWTRTECAAETAPSRLGDVIGTVPGFGEGFDVDALRDEWERRCASPSSSNS
ncbi:hypothetical protein [Allosalinactinospora lopnorensis]|uniref:hypothetical protein n=1 Tax=Allosalinactinospora lopnorensis TaxID=1352348 RepID=UPI000623E62C|nr:hypothetical protein [Allosalinactinospora lopnorensis]